MLLGIALVLLALWVIGLLTHMVFYGLIHVLLVVAVILFIIHLFQRRRT
jgi:hypothetical protein